MNRLAVAAKRFHAERGDTAAVQFGEYLLLEAVEVRVKRVQRHLHRVKWKAGGQHLQVNGWVLMSGESDKPYLAFLLGL